MVERIAGKQDILSLIIEDPLRAPPNSPKYKFYLHFGPYMKNWFSNCFHYYYVSTVMRSTFADPGFYIGAQHNSEKN